MEPTDCRFHFPGAILHFTCRYQRELDEFYEEDEEAAEIYDALLRHACDHGLTAEVNAELGLYSGRRSNHRAPVGLDAFTWLRPGTKPVPWIGEITAYGSDAVDDRGPFWRGYYSDLREPSDPTLEIDDVLMASVRAKGGAGGVKHGEQDRHILAAGDEVRQWCKDNKQFTFRIQL